MEESSALDVSFPLHLPARRRCPQCGRGVLCLRARRDDWVYVCDACSTMERAEVGLPECPTCHERHYTSPALCAEQKERELTRRPWGPFPGQGRPPIFEAAEVPKQERADTQHVGPLTER